MLNYSLKNGWYENGLTWENGKWNYSKQEGSKTMSKYEILEGRWDYVKDLTDVMELAKKEAEAEDNLYYKGLLENALGCLGAALYILQDRQVLPQFGE